MVRGDRDKAKRGEAGSNFASVFYCLRYLSIRSNGCSLVCPPRKEWGIGETRAFEPLGAGLEPANTILRLRARS